MQRRVREGIGMREVDAQLPTLTHEIRAGERILKSGVQRETRRIRVDGLTSSQLFEAARGEEVVGQCDAAAAGDGEDFVLAVAVEGGPLNLGCGGGCAAPGEADIVAFVTDGELTT